MRTNRLHYLHQMPDKKFNFKSILLTFIAAIFLSACGIKGDLYQTPEQAVIPQDKVVEQNDTSEKIHIKKSVKPQDLTVITVDESEQQQAVLQSTEQTTSLVKQPTDQVKEQQ
jgi:predicted small lipoprotein YifL